MSLRLEAGGQSQVRRCTDERSRHRRGPFLHDESDVGARGGLRAVTDNGVLGDPTGASSEEGERLLREAFGTEFEAYARKVPALIPGIY